MVLQQRSGPGPSKPGGIANRVAVNGSAGPTFGNISPKKNSETVNIVSVAQPTSGSVARVRNFNAVITM